MTWSIRSRVIDITRDRPRDTDRLWVDSCVWIKVAYTRTSVNEARPYANYLNSLIKAGAALYTGTVNYAEVAKHVESTELSVWLRKNNDTRQPHVMLKTFRGDVAERKNVVEEIEAAWRQMAKLSLLSQVALQPACILDAVTGMDNGDFLDGADALQVREAMRNGIDQILTDDKDFASVQNITVFTALRPVLDAARQAGMLVER